MAIDAQDLKQTVVNALGLRGVQRARLTRQAVRNGWIDDPKKTDRKGKS